jgi:MtaA/CmuA family methyltransferase
MVRCAEDFDLDWVTVMSDPFCEAEAFGLAVEYPANDLPVDVGGHLTSLEEVAALRHYQPLEHRRTRSRIDEIREFKRRCGERYFIVGWVEGPVAEYADIRGVAEAAMDFLDDPETVGKALDVIVESALEFIRLQVEAGAHCIGIGDAFCSQIGPTLYRDHAFERERRMIDYIHSLGALAKLHICGNTAPIQADMIRTGADIVDVDHLVPEMGRNVALLGPRQVFSGKPDPVSVVQNGTLELLEAQTRDCHVQTGGRCIVSAGCEITPGTTVERMRAYRELCDRLR